MLFCPKCGNPLSETPNGLTCEAGKMEITKDLEKRFRECYVLKLRKPHEMPFSFPPGEWFCPQCGIQTHEEEGNAYCSKCQLSLNEFIHSLVERHIHINEVNSHNC